MNQYVLSEEMLQELIDWRNDRLESYGEVLDLGDFDTLQEHMVAVMGESLKNLKDRKPRYDRMLIASCLKHVQDSFWTYEDLPEDGKLYLTVFCDKLGVTTQMLSRLEEIYQGYGYNNFFDLEEIQVIAYCKQLPEVKV